MYRPEWIEVKKPFSVQDSDQVWLTLPEGLYLRRQEEVYFLTDGDGFDLHQYTFSFESLQVGLESGDLVDCVDGIYMSFLRAVSRTREAQKLYFNRRSKPLLDLAKREEKSLDELLEMVQPYRPDEELVKETQEMRYHQRVYFSTASSYAKNKAIALEKKVDKLLSAIPSPTPRTIQSSLF